ncbi:short transient receptor potential channel 4-like [Bolinopsis microptera]|uniref:short transient receptor potential channel 4-like n=1 Tax=Bolinopsis microptera TaxID=2820187 RepID=UPI00307AE471
MQKGDVGETSLNLTALESIDDLHERHDLKKIFTLIEEGDHTGVEKVLAEMGHKVEITPKIGCSPIHYSKLNFVNWEDENEDSPLIKAAKVDCKMVRIIIMYGGNPNHANKDGDTPLSIAAYRRDRDTIDALFLAGGDLMPAVQILTSPLRCESEKHLKEYSRNGQFSIRPLKFLLAGDVYLKCKDPIKTAFDVCKDITSIKNERMEFEIEFESIIEDADSFAYKFLSHCDNMLEAREILTSSDKLLSTAIGQSKKKFVSHPFNLQIINEQWYGKFHSTFFRGKAVLILKYVTSPIVLPLLFLKFFFYEECCGVPFMKSSVSNLLRFISVPCVCFATDLINYIIFAVVMIAACLTPFNGEDLAGGLGGESYKVTYVEYILYFTVFARILMEADQLIQKGFMKHYNNFWNMVDATVLGLIVTAAIYKGYINVVNTSDNDTFSCENVKQKLRHEDSMNVNYIYAVAEFVLVLRLLGLLEIHQSLGTMLIALKHLIADAARFGLILVIVMLGTTVAIYSMTIALNEWNKELSTLSLTCDKVEVPDAFVDFLETFRNVFWATFGLFDVVELKITGDQPTTYLITLIMILYVLLSCILLLNMLIAILGNTFSRVIDNCDIEWKYAQSKLLKEYSRAQPLLFPFVPIAFPFMIWFRAKLKQEHTMKDTRNQAKHDKLIAAVCDRIMFGDLMSGSKTDGDTINKALDKRVSLKRQESVLAVIAEKVKERGNV